MKSVYEFSKVVILAFYIFIADKEGDRLPCKCYSRNNKVVASREQYMRTDHTARINCCRMLSRWAFNLPFNFLTNSWFSSDV